MMNTNTPKPTTAKLILRGEKALQIRDKKYALMEVSPAELHVYRAIGKPSFVLKVDGKLYYARIPIRLNLISSKLLGDHQCSAVGHECYRLSAAMDEEGGCKKVRDRYKRIESYPWIETGYETFGTHHDAFVVGKCLNFEEFPSRRKPSDARGS